MKCFLSILVLAMVCFGTLPQAVASEVGPSAKLCKILGDAFLGAYSPEELCKKHEGRFCSDMKTLGQGVCSANGKNFCDSYETVGEALCEAAAAPFCSSMETMASGICSILKGSFCDAEVDEAKWKKKLSKACYW